MSYLLDKLYTWSVIVVLLFILLVVPQLVDKW